MHKQSHCPQSFLFLLSPLSSFLCFSLLFTLQCTCPAFWLPPSGLPLFAGLVPHAFPSPLTCSNGCHERHMPLRCLFMCVCLHVCTNLERMWPSSGTGGEERRRENEQGGRVYAFSLSSLIINVSQVRKIASCSSCSISPSSSPPLAFLSLIHSVVSPPPSCVGYFTLSISISPQTQSSGWWCYGRRNANVQATSIQSRYPPWLSSWPVVWSGLVTVCCHNNREMSNPVQNLVLLSVKM